MLAQILAPLGLPILHLVTLFTVPATAVYALLGLVTAPLTIPLMVISKVLMFALFSPLLFVTLPITIPLGGALAFCCVAKRVACAFFTVFTPLLWPLAFLWKWFTLTCTISQVLVHDTVAPWMVPVRFTFLTALLGGKAAL